MNTYPRPPAPTQAFLPPSPRPSPPPPPSFVFSQPGAAVSRDVKRAESTARPSSFCPSFAVAGGEVRGDNGLLLDDKGTEEVVFHPSDEYFERGEGGRDGGKEGHRWEGGKEREGRKREMWGFGGICTYSRTRLFLLSTYSAAPLRQRGRLPRPLPEGTFALPPSRPPSHPPSLPLKKTVFSHSSYCPPPFDFLPSSFTLVYRRPCCFLG